MHCGQPWRAACLLGWIPNHDPNYSNPLTDTKLPIEGNPNRSLWKMCAWELSQDKRIGNNLFNIAENKIAIIIHVECFVRIIYKYFKMLKFLINFNFYDALWIQLFYS